MILSIHKYIYINSLLFFIRGIYRGVPGGSPAVGYEPGPSLHLWGNDKKSAMSLTPLKTA
jgi:hypothetical protein